MNDKLYEKCRKKGLKFKHVAEIGVYLPETSNILKFIGENIQTTLVEANPDSVKKIKEYFASNVNVTIYPYAVWDRGGQVTFNKAESSSFVDELEISPAVVNDYYISSTDKQIVVESKTFDEIDDGTIDLLSVDIEGGEWYVLKYLKSKPVIISIETNWKNYINPFIGEINEWLNQNGYVIWYTDKSDTIYMKENLFQLEILEKLKLKYAKKNKSDE